MPRRNNGSGDYGGGARGPSSPGMAPAVESLFGADSWDGGAAFHASNSSGGMSDGAASSTTKPRSVHVPKLRKGKGPSAALPVFGSWNAPQPPPNFNKGSAAENAAAQAAAAAIRAATAGAGADGQPKFTEVFRAKGEHRGNGQCAWPEYDAILAKQTMMHDRLRAEQMMTQQQQMMTHQRQSSKVNFRSASFE
ncbi:unnamed protein product [Closterium sp. NIES-53]